MTKHQKHATCQTIAKQQHESSPNYLRTGLCRSYARLVDAEPSAAAGRRAGLCGHWLPASPLPGVKFIGLAVKPVLHNALSMIAAIAGTHMLLPTMQRNCLSETPGGASILLSGKPWSLKYPRNVSLRPLEQKELAPACPRVKHGDRWYITFALPSDEFPKLVAKSAM